MEKYSDLIVKIDQYYNLCLYKSAYIKQIGNKWRVLSRKGKNLGTFDTKEEAEKHLKQVEYFKYLGKKASKNEIDLTKIDNLSYSAIMRQLRKQCNPSTVKEFLKLYKLCFDSLTNHEINHAPELALICALQLFSRDHIIQFKIKKSAGTAELGEATRVGQYLSDIIKFTLNRIDPSKRAKAMNTVLRKIYFLNENELSNKRLPQSSAMGQAITFVKHVLFDQPPTYIREVLNNIAQHLR